MNELVTVENDEVVVSSRQIAESFNKAHGDVLKSIDHLVRENSLTKNMFHELNREYKGQSFRYFAMNRDGFSLLVMGFTGKKALEWKLKYIHAFNEMEKQLANKNTLALPDFNNPAEAARAWANEYEAKQKALAENAIMKPKADFYDTVVSTESLLSMGDTAKLINKKGVGRNNLYKILKARKILMADNIPYQQYIERGYFKVVESYYMAGDNKVITKTTYVKQKGVDYIRKLLSTEVPA